MHFALEFRCGKLLGHPQGASLIGGEHSVIAGDLAGAFDGDGRRSTELLHRLAARVIQAEHVDDVADAALDAIEAALGTPRAAVLLYDEGGVMRFRRWRGLSDGYRAAVEGHSPWSRDVRMPSPIIVPDVRAAEDLAAYRRLFEVERIGALGFFPLVAAGHLVGKFMVYYDAPRDLELDQIEMASAISNHVAAGVARFAALDRERRGAEALEQLYRAERAARREVEALFRISGALSSAALDLEAIVQLVTDEATALTGAEFGAFFYSVLAQHDEAFLLYTLSGAPKEAFSRFELPRSTPLFAPTFAGEGVIRIDDVKLDPRYGKMGPHHGMPEGHLPVTSYLAVPVVSRSGAVIGGLFFGHCEPARFTEQHARMVTVLAANAAVAVDNARLFREAREAQEIEARRARERAFAGEVGATFTEGGPIEATLQRCCELAIEHLDVAIARLWTVDETGRVLELRASAGPPIPIGDAQHRIPLGESRIGEIATTRRPLLANDATGDPALHGSVAFAGYPLIVEETVVGVFAMFTARSLASDTFEALASVARTIAIGIERARAAAQRERLVEELERTVHFNEMFAGILGHDLRNPLGAIVAAANLLLLNTEDSKSFSWIRRILGSSERMTRMVDQLLDFTRVRIGGGLALARHPCDLRELARQTVEEIELANPGWRFVFESTGELAGHWHGDRLVQVLSNLISNAVQHGSPDRPLVVRLDGTQPLVRVEIQNHGAIPPELLPALFDPFRSAKHKRDGARGLGLGLFITEQIVRAHGGELAVSSSESEGTTFWFQLPRG
jgi:GAF domain-containing protein